MLRAELGIPADEMVIAGMSMGWADNDLPENRMTLQKHEVESFASFIEQ